MLKIKTILVFAAFLISATTSNAQTPTFHLDIAPIIYNNCTECHRVGELGPMPLTTYDEVAANGFYIEYVTQSGYMPPWTPDHNYTTLNGERFLTEDEKQTIVDWVGAGMPEGDLSDNPGMPDFDLGMQLGAPDLVLTMSEPYLHGGDGLEQYQVFIIPTGITETVEILAVEIVPSNNAIAHHGLIGYTSNPSSINAAAALDDADPASGYESFGDYGVPVSDRLFGGWAPGIQALMFPSTIGKIMEPGSQLLLQMHYGPAYQDELDQTTINLYFAEEPIEREVETYTMTPANLSVPFYVPANEEVSFHGSVYIEDDISVISTIPHSHLVGKSWLVYATSPDNQDTIPMISIPRWDFHWQGIFNYPNLLHIPGGYTIHAIAEYDNTSLNPFNPNNPPQPMWFGDFTTDEMYVLFFQFVEYLPGDEDISIISDPIVGCLGDVVPNGSIDISDILLTLSQYGCLSDCDTDINGDGAVTISDVLAVLAVFGELC
ncbi:MAG: hypothetical protein QMB09_04740 [Flavobacteriales bacterium]|jgi:hypothetical protein